MKTIELDNVQIAYIDQGQGEPILMLHGYPEDHRAWRHQIDYFSQHYRVLAFDWPGWGESSKQLNVDCSYKAESLRIKQFLDQFSIDKVNLFLHDYGGYVGLNFIANHPHRIKRLAILNSRAHRTFPTPYYQLTELVIKISQTPIFSQLLENLPLKLIHQFGLLPYLRRGSFSPQIIAKYLTPLNHSMGKKWWIQFLKKGYELPAKPQLIKDLYKLKIPSTIIWGDQDPWCPPLIARELNAALPQATLNWIKQASHFVMEERPEEVNQALIDLLSTNL